MRHYFTRFDIAAETVLVSISLTCFGTDAFLITLLSRGIH